MECQNRTLRLHSNCKRTTACSKLYFRALQYQHLDQNHHLLTELEDVRPHPPATKGPLTPQVIPVSRPAGDSVCSNLLSVQPVSHGLLLGQVLTYYGKHEVKLNLLVEAECQ